MTIGSDSENSGMPTMSADEITVSRSELKAMVSELMAEVLHEMRPASAVVKETSGKPTIEVKEYANTAAEAVTSALAAWRTGMTGIGRPQV